MTVLCRENSCFGPFGLFWVKSTLPVVTFIWFWAIFGHFQVRKVSFHPWDTLNSVLGAKMELLCRVEHNRNNLKVFSHHFYNRVFTFSAYFDVEVTRFGAISAKKCLLVAYFNNYCFQMSPMRLFVIYIMGILI